VPVNITNTKSGYRVYITPIIPQAPYKDVAAAIPGKIEVENYDVGGSGKAYSDKDDDNKGGEYRDDAVDIVKAGNGYAIGYTQEGEWLEYTVKVAKSGEYNLNASYATSSENVGFKLYVDGNAVTDNIIVPQGADWETYSTYEAGKVNLTEGEHVLKLEIVGNYVNLDWFEFVDPSQTTTRFATAPALQRTSVTYDVFSATGKFLDRADFGATATESLAASLKQAGYASGVYLVRTAAGRTQRIQVR
jgi:hypothetical protein